MVDDVPKQGGQTKEHTMLVRTMGVTHVIVAINKMDDKTVEWSEKRFNDMQRELLDFLKKSGFKKEQISFVPLSALNNINLKDTVDPTVCPWYKGKVREAESSWLSDKRTGAAADAR